MDEKDQKRLRRAGRAWNADARISGCLLWLLGLATLGVGAVVLYALLGVVGVVLAVVGGLVVAVAVRALIHWAS